MSIRWTLKHIDELVAAGKVRGYVIHKSEPKICTTKPIKICKDDPIPVTYIESLLKKHGIEYEREHRFSERKFRFDFALIDKKVAIEYEGIFSNKSRHTTATGYSKDAEKYNLAQSLGWKVFRYTQLNYKNFEIDLKAIST